MQGRSRIELMDVASRARAMPSINFNVLAIPTVADWGPMNEATVVVDWSDYTEKFGGLLASYEGPLQVKRFFDLGGRRAVIVRVCHVTSHVASSTPATALKATHSFKTAVGGGYSAVNTLRVDGLYYGSKGNNLSVAIATASNGSASYFDLLVYYNDVLSEWYQNMSMDSTDANYVEDVINTKSSKSKWIAVTDLDISTLASDKMPTTIVAQDLTGGNDGLTGLVDADYLGATNYHTGLNALNLVQDGDMLIVPDKASSTSFINNVITWLDSVKHGKVLLITDTPANSDKAGAAAHETALTATEYRTGAYWPGIKISNPDKTIYGQVDTVTIRTSGSAAGRYAKNAQTEKTQMWSQPGNPFMGWLDGASGLETDSVKEPSVRDYVTPYKINPVMSGFREDGAFGVWLDDVQLGRKDFNFKSIGEGRGVCYLRKLFELYLERHRTQNNTEERRESIKLDMEAELLKHMEMGAFINKDASDAFYVNTDPEGKGLNNPLVQDDETLRVLVAVATARAARLVQLMFTRDSRAIESYIQQQLAANS